MQKERFDYDRGCRTLKFISAMIIRMKYRLALKLAGHTAMITHTLLVQT